MGYTVRISALGSDSPTLLCAQLSQGTRDVQISNVGFVPVYVGDAGVSIGAGVILRPGDPPYDYDQPDELYAIANNGSVAVDERRA